ncbi:MAG TPA: hypothetical protein VGM34_01330 [Chlamydiales bacterium]|jgi:hypothetical protein
MNRIISVFSYLKRQLTNAFAFERRATSIQLHSDSMDDLNAQIGQAIESCSERLIFLLGPFGSGKTTQLQYFFKTHPQFRPKVRSFIKINTLDNAFLHLTNYFSRFSFFSLVLVAAAAIGFTSFIPQLGVLPVLLLISALFFMKSVGNLVYLFHETVSSFFQSKKEIVVIEDLERSSLSLEEQGAFLANLWRYQRIYLIPLGYPPNEKKQILKLVELSLKLDGILIELLVREPTLYEFIKKLDSDFPFVHLEKDIAENKGWLSLFTFRELQLLHSQVKLRLGSLYVKEQKQLKYIDTAFALLAEKLDLAKKEITFIETERTLKGFSKEKLSSEQVHYLDSFIHSIADVKIQVIA